MKKYIRTTTSADDLSYERLELIVAEIANISNDISLDSEAQMTKIKTILEFYNLK